MGTVCVLEGVNQKEKFLPRTAHHRARELLWCKVTAKQYLDGLEYGGKSRESWLCADFSIKKCVLEKGYSCFSCVNQWFTQLSFHEKANWRHSRAWKKDMIQTSFLILCLCNILEYKVASVILLSMQCWDKWRQNWDLQGLQLCRAHIYIYIYSHRSGPVNMLNTGNITQDPSAN